MKMNRHGMRGPLLATISLVGMVLASQGLGGCGPYMMMGMQPQPMVAQQGFAQPAQFTQPGPVSRVATEATVGTNESTLVLNRGLFVGRATGGRTIIFDIEGDGSEQDPENLSPIYYRVCVGDTCPQPTASDGSPTGTLTENGWVGMLPPNTAVRNGDPNTWTSAQTGILRLNYGLHVTIWCYTGPDFRAEHRVGHQFSVNVPTTTGRNQHMRLAPRYCGI